MKNSKLKNGVATVRWLVLLHFAFCIFNCAGQVPPPPPATQAEVNAGVVKNKFVSPATLAGYPDTNALSPTQLGQLNNLVTNNPVEVTVSPVGIATGLSVSNNGAMLGPDTPGLNGKITVTYGIDEYLSNIVKQTSVGATNFNAVDFHLGAGVYFASNSIYYSNGIAFSFEMHGAGKGATRWLLATTNLVPVLNIGSIAYDSQKVTGGSMIHLHDMTFSALNAKHRMITITNYSDFDMERCGVYMWEAFTNTQTGANLSIFGNGVQQMTNLPCEGLVGISFYGGGELHTRIYDCNFFGLADGIEQPASDHMLCDQNIFGQIGKASIYITTNLYSLTDELSLGACYIGNPNLTCSFEDDHLYSSLAGLVFNTGGIGVSAVTIKDVIIEGTPTPVAIDADGGIIAENIGTTQIYELNGPSSGWTVQPNYGIGGTFEPTMDSLFDMNNTLGRFTISGALNMAGGNINQSGNLVLNGSVNTDAGALASDGAGNVTLKTLKTTGTHIPVTVTVGASPFIFTNTTGAALECYFSGSVAYSISKNGVGIYGSLTGNDYFVLQPTNRTIITYSVAPTMFTNQW